VFVLGRLVVRQIPFLKEQVSTVLGHADQGSGRLLVLITAVNPVAEELLPWRRLRGHSRHPVAGTTTAAYALATFATGNMVLASAAVLLGLVVGLERRASSGVLAPVLTHVTRSLAMLFALPLLFG